MAAPKLPPLAVRERQQRVLELREQGLSPLKIAKETGCSPALVYRDLKEILQRTQAHEEELAEHYRRVELQRLDSMQQSWWARATGNATKQDGTKLPADEKAAQVVLRIMERRAKLLGLDAPTLTKSEVDVRFGDRLDLVIERGIATVEDNRAKREAFLRSDGSPRLPSTNDLVIDITPENENAIVVEDFSDSEAEDGHFAIDGAPVSPDAGGVGGITPSSTYEDTSRTFREDPPGDDEC